MKELNSLDSILDSLIETSKKSNTLYHVTKHECVSNILENGLVPTIGGNSKSADEQDNLTCLCDYESIPYWLIICGADTVLKVDVSNVGDLEYVDYYTYSELRTTQVIPPERISVLNEEVCTLRAMHDLCIQYVDMVSSACRRVANYYDYGNIDGFPIHQSLLIVLNRLDYSCVSKEVIRKVLVELGDGGTTTFCDFYKNTGKKLYEVVSLYPEDEYLELRQQLYDLIVEKFDGCLDVDTGGYT